MTVQELMSQIEGMVDDGVLPLGAEVRVLDLDNPRDYELLRQTGCATSPDGSALTLWY